MPVLETKFLSEEELAGFIDIRNSYRHLCGFIIVRVEGGVCVGYIDHFCGFADFGDGSKAEDPKTYLSLPILNKALGHYKVKWPEYELASAIWVHPEADYQPIAKYILMTGEKLSGSVRR